MKSLLCILILAVFFIEIYGNATAPSNPGIVYYSRSASEWRILNSNETESTEAAQSDDSGGYYPSGASPTPQIGSRSGPPEASRSTVAAPTPSPSDSGPSDACSSDDEERERAEEPLKYGVKYERLGKLSTPEECARPCVLGAEPMTCYYHFTVELYRTLGGACRLCQPKTNTSLTSDCQCILADGVDQSGLMTVNRMFPGPSIQMCLGDLAVIDVHNKALGTGITIHWHGLYQNGYQYYDGVPFVTQCPISHGSTFRYKWHAYNAGTHFYHAHTGLHKPDGLEGAIIIRTPKSKDLNRRFYDEDNFDNIIFVNDWFHESAVDHWPGTTTRNVGHLPINILINGKGQWFDPVMGGFTDIPLTVFNVKPNRRIRFRMINSLSWTCPVQFSIQDHNLTIISTDGEDVKPHTVNTITSFSAERYDFVIATDKEPRTYWVQARLTGNCESKHIVQVALLRYAGTPVVEPNVTRPAYKSALPSGVVFNEMNEVCSSKNPDRVCLNQLKSAERINYRIQAWKPDVSIFLPFYFYVFSNEELFEPNYYRHFQVPTGGNGSVALLANISNVFTGSPLLTQRRNIAPSMICNSTSKPKTCVPGKPCFCTHVIDIPLGSVVDIIMADVGPTGISHPFHIHGYGCHVMAQGLLRDVPLTEDNKFDALRLHRNFYGSLNRRPVVKDTLATPAGGYTICRFIADNPGYWLYHCHFMSHLLVGMDLTLHVGTKADLPRVPRGFPKCGDFKPRIH